MPELGELIPWDQVSWDNMSAQSYSGMGQLQRRPYYFRVMGNGTTARILLISAVPSKTQPGALHATDYLRLDRDALRNLMVLGQSVFDAPT